MRFIRMVTAACTLGCALLLGACATPVAPEATAPWQNLPPIRENTIARIMVDGPNAYLNGKPTGNGAYVVDGDTVSTGPGTSMKLILNEGGYIQLDENTDPTLKEGVCLLLKLLHGQVLFSNMKCQQLETPNMAAVANSLVNVTASNVDTRLTVLQGHVDVSAPATARVENYQQYTAAYDGRTTIVQLTPEQAVATATWTRRYFNARPATGQGSQRGVSPGAAAVIGGAIGAVIEAIRHGDSSSPPPNTTVTPAPPVSSGASGTSGTSQPSTTTRTSPPVAAPVISAPSSTASPATPSATPPATSVRSPSTPSTARQSSPNRSIPGAIRDRSRVPRDISGWCCVPASGGSGLPMLRQTTRTQCTASGGQFFINGGDASAACNVPK